MEIIEKFCNQIDMASEKECNMVIMGDANLSSLKWNNAKFLNKNVSIPLRNVLDQNGLVYNEVGVTY